MSQEVKFIEQLKIVKFLNVKTPVGINQRGESISNYSIGIDLYMPVFDENFLQALTVANHKLYPDINYVEIFDAETEEVRAVNIFMDNDCTDCIAKINYYKDLETGLYTKLGKIQIDLPIQIPTGIGMDIPDWVWCEVRTKSSNFSQGWTEVHGTVDMNYTYGVGVQILPINDEVKIESNQKFAQLVMHEAVPVLEIVEVAPREWSELPNIIDKRGTRVGGFGSTGKFDNKTETNNASN